MTIMVYVHKDKPTYMMPIVTESEYRLQQNVKQNTEEQFSCCDSLQLLRM